MTAENERITESEQYREDISAEEVESVSQLQQPAPDPFQDPSMVQRILLVRLALAMSVCAATGEHENSFSIDQLSR